MLSLSNWKQDYFEYEVIIFPISLFLVHKTYCSLQQVSPHIEHTFKHILHA